MSIRFQRLNKRTNRRAGMSRRTFLISTAVAGATPATMLGGVTPVVAAANED